MTIKVSLNIEEDWYFLNHLFLAMIDTSLEKLCLRTNKIVAFSNIKDYYIDDLDATLYMSRPPYFYSNI